MSSLAGSAARGAAVTMLGQLVRLAVQLVSLVVLSRLLTATDFGLVAMVTVIVGIGELVRDFGLSNAAIQARQITQQQQANLFWISSALGLTIAIAVATGAPFIAGFYGRQELVGIALALSLTFVLNGLSAQHKALLARNLRFRSLALVETIAPLAAAVAAIVMAALGGSYWSVVVQQLGQAMIGLALVLVLTRWLPARPRRVDGMAPLVLYGVHLLGAQLVTYATRNVDRLVIGRLFGAAELGFYNRSFELVMNPLTQISAPSSRVAIPVLAKLQDERARYDAYLLHGQRVLLAAVVPTLALIMAIAEPLIFWLLGERWAPVVPLLQILAAAGLLRMVGYPTYWVALSKGATKVSLYVNIVAAPFCIGMVLVGSLWGTVGVAFGVLGGSFVTWLISLIWYARAANAPSGKLLVGALVAIVANVPAAGAAYLVSGLVLAEGGVPLRLVLGIGAFVAVYALTAVIFRPLRRDLQAVLATIKKLSSR